MWLKSKRQLLILRNCHQILRLSLTPVLEAWVAHMVGAEFEHVAAARDVGEGVAGEGVVAAVLIGVELEVSGVWWMVGFDKVEIVNGQMWLNFW